MVNRAQYLKKKGEMFHRRKGASLVFFTFMAILVVVGAVISNLFFMQFISELDTKTSENSETQYESFAVREEILHAECATKQRAIFYRSAVENPDQLNCIATQEPIVVWFLYRNRDGNSFDDTIYSYKITPGNPSDVSTEATDRTLKDLVDYIKSAQDYPIVVYDRDTDTYYQGLVGFTTQ